MSELPNPLPNDLNALQTLIAERQTRLNVIDDEIHAKREEKYGVNREIFELQNHGRALLGIKPFPKKKEPTDVA